MSEHNKEPKKPAGGGGGMMGGGGGGGPVQKATDFKGSMLKLIRYMGVYKFAIVGVMIAAVIATVLNVVGPKILGNATTELFRGMMATVSNSGPGVDFGYIATIVLVLLGLYIIALLFAFVQGWIMATIAMKITYNMRRDISDKMHKLPFNYYDGTTNGEILSYITNDVDAVGQSLNQSVTQIITSIAQVVGIFVMMLTISWELTIVALIIVPLSLGIVMIIGKKSQKYFVEQQDYLGHVNGHVEEMYSAHTIVQAFNREEESAKTFEGYNNTLYKSAWISQFLSGLMMPIILFIGNLGYVGVCLLGGYLVVNNGLPVGDIQAFMQYVRQFTQPLQTVANISNIIQQTAASSERIFDFLALEEEMPEKENALTVQHDQKLPGTDTCIRVEGNVEFDHVSFGYNPDQMIIKDFSSVAKPGQKIAIVGPTGAGKTTMVKLLMRFYDVNGGGIKVEGKDIRDFKRAEIRSAFGMVVQDTWLYNASIADNIRYGKLDATDEEVVDAAKAAQVDHFVKTFPDGYKTIMNEESSNVSQGQKQLLTIARAILADPEILILDEATSSVDTRTEIMIQKAMDTLMEGRTSFVIAHRLSTIKNADNILVMKDGDIVEQGTHDGLIAEGGFYADLYNSQFEHISE